MSLNDDGDGGNIMPEDLPVSQAFAGWSGDTPSNVRFSYDHIPFDLASLLRASAARIKNKNKDLVQAASEIGQLLVEAKAKLSHGHFGDWIQAELRMNDRTARNYMSVYNAFGRETETISDLPMHTVYALASPSVSTEARMQVLQDLQGENPPSPAAIRKVVQSSRAATRQAKSENESDATPGEADRTAQSDTGKAWDDDWSSAQRGLYNAAKIICAELSQDLPVLLEHLRRGLQTELVREIEEFLEMAQEREAIKVRIASLEGRRILPRK